MIGIQQLVKGLGLIGLIKRFLIHIEIEENCDSRYKNIIDIWWGQRSSFVFVVHILSISIISSEKWWIALNKNVKKKYTNTKTIPSINSNNYNSSLSGYFRKTTKRKHLKKTRYGKEIKKSNEMIIITKKYVNEEY